MSTAGSRLAYPNSAIAEPEPPDGSHESAERQVLVDGVRVLRFQQVKKVVKRWGLERWLHETDAPYGFKVIRINAGCRTSLQYHEHKRESYFVLEGDAVLHYRSEVDAPTQTTPFPAGTLVHVDAGAIHRVEAVTDIILVEVSTYDDGTDNIRIEDDYGRKHGRISEEH